MLKFTTGYHNTCMHIFHSTKEFFLEFLFPKSYRSKELESMSPEDILRKTLPAEPVGKKDTFAIFDYKDSLAKDLVWELKYGGNRKVADTLGVILADTIQDELSDITLFQPSFSGDGESKILIIPIPMSIERRLKRGWNQSELLCKSLSKHLGGEFEYLPGYLHKVKHTESQTQTRSKKERMENIAGSMKVVSKKSLEGTSAIVVDDVTTTGATFAEARRALEDAGVKKVLCVAIAH